MERLLSLKTKRVGPSPKNKSFAIPVSAAGSALGNNRITIVGKTAGVQVLKTKRSILPLRLSSLLPLAPRSILVSMSTLDTEPGCDFLYLSVKSSGGVEDFLLALRA
ncbi:hypothetical protein BASA60_006019 [Batrachochytrium salamandrivorans]|nr:hypothetical protein BASA60_006019 [Batrachochytrium salamandrivorans]